MHSEVRTAKNWYWWLWLSPFFTFPTVVFISFSEPGYLLVCNEGWRNCDHELAALAGGLIAVFGSALWHLVLLIPTLDKQSAFVRWHGRQALLLVGIRTAVPVTFLVIDFVLGGNGVIAFLSIPILIVIWLFGTLWGQLQASRSKCTLMQWAGASVELSSATETARPTTTSDSRDPLSQKKHTHHATYLQSINLLQRGKTDEAVQIFHKLLVSEASPELKAQVAEKLKGVGKIDDALSPDVLVAIFRFSHDPEQQRIALTRLQSLGLVETL